MPALLVAAADPDRSLHAHDQQVDTWHERNQRPGGAVYELRHQAWQ